MKDLLEIATATIIEAKKYSISFLEKPEILSSNYKDIKTELDCKLNEFIIDNLSKYGIKIISEEINNDPHIFENNVWIIDPLDGTLNLSIKYPCSSISIALFKDMQPIIGVVQDLFYNTIYTSSLNGGSKKNNIQIQVSNTENIKDAVLATGFPSGGNYDTNYLTKFVQSVQNFKKVRAIGSASLMLSYVAEGVFDVYYEKDIYLWDVAAGIALVKEAGGEYYLNMSNDGFKCEVLASNKKIFLQAKKALIND